MLALAFERINERFLEPVDLQRVGLSGLAGLTRLDRRLRLSVGDGYFGFRRGDTMPPFAVFRLPAADDSHGWAATVTAAIHVVRTRSETLSIRQDEEIYQAVIRGFLAELDGYSRYHSAAEAQHYREKRDGYGGIGITVRLRDGVPMVSDVAPDSPASRAGITADSPLTGINDSALDNLSPRHIHNLLHGPVGSWITVAVGAGENATTHRLRRERIFERTVTIDKRDDTALISVSRFNAATADQLDSALREIAQWPNAPRGLVLDMRGNPGGLLDQAVTIADLFLDRDSPILTTQGRHPGSYQRYDARHEDRSMALPLAVLLDGGSASSAEIVASALKDNARAVVIGSRSLGKGSVQSVTRLPNDGELLLTWSLMHGPSGKTFHGRGVTPHICLSAPVDDADDCRRIERSGEVGDVDRAIALIQDPTAYTAAIKQPQRSLAEAF